MSAIKRFSTDPALRPFAGWVTAKNMFRKGDDPVSGGALGPAHGSAECQADEDRCIKCTICARTADRHHLHRLHQEVTRDEQEGEVLTVRHRRAALHVLRPVARRVARPAQSIGSRPRPTSPTPRPLVELYVTWTSCRSGRWRRRNGRGDRQGIPVANGPPSLLRLRRAGRDLGARVVTMRNPIYGAIARSPRSLCGGPFLLRHAEFLRSFRSSSTAGDHGALPVRHHVINLHRLPEVRKFTGQRGGALLALLVCFSGGFFLQRSSRPGLAARGLVPRQDRRDWHGALAAVAWSLFASLLPCEIARSS